MPSDIETLLAIEAIKKLKARYFRCMDTHDWDGLADVFAADCRFDPHGALEENPDTDGTEPIVGRDAATQYIIAGIAPITSAHFGHMPEIEILSDTEATGIWALADILRTPTGEPFDVFRGYGHYHETYVKEGGQWRIAALRITRMLVEMR